MSKALRLAKESHERKGPRGMKKEGLTPQEEYLLMTATMALDKAPEERLAEWKQCEEVALRLDGGGVIDMPFIERMKHRQAASYQRQQALERERRQEGAIQRPGVDDIAAAHMCRQDVSELRECYVTDLYGTKGAPAKGRFLSVKTVEDPFKISSIQCCVEDKRGTAITLSIYNVVSMYATRDEVDRLFPIGTTITIKEPYLKCSNQGYLTLRVDNPCNIIVSLPPVISFKGLSPKPEALKADGNASFKAKEYAAAVDLYSKGLDAVQDIRKTLFSNRAAGHLKLCLYPLAKGDCDNVLALEPTHAKAVLRREEAMRGMSATPPEAAPSEPDAPLGTAASDAVVVDVDVDALRLEGNDHFKKGSYEAAVEAYSRGLVAARHLFVALLSNRAASYLHLFNGKAALADCDAALALEPAHVKAAARREQAADLVRRCEEQKQGRYDYRTLPLAPGLQQHVENYYGPIEIRPAGKKGRGLFVTRDVRIGELLLAEKAFAFKEESQREVAISLSSGVLNKGSTIQMVWEMTMLVNKDPVANAQLALLSHDLQKPSACIPAMASLRNPSLLDAVPVISAKQVHDAVKINSFSFNYLNEPTDKERLAVTSSLCAGVDPVSFHRGYQSRQDRVSAGVDKKKVGKGGPQMSDGTAVWIVGSFMNHAYPLPSGAREFFGNIMFVHAALPLKAGDEVTTQYSTDKEALRHWGIN